MRQLFSMAKNKHSVFCVMGCYYKVLRREWGLVVSSEILKEFFWLLWEQVIGGKGRDRETS